MINWEKIDHFTGKPYKKNPKSGSWNIIDYKADDLRIVELPNGNREVSKNGKKLGEFKTLKAAKAFAETL